MNRVIASTVSTAILCAMAGFTPAEAEPSGEICVVFDIQVRRSGLTHTDCQELIHHYRTKTASLTRMSFLVGEERKRTLQKYGVFAAGEINQRTASMIVSRTPVKWYMTAGIAARKGNMVSIYVLLDDSNPETRWISFHKTVVNVDVPSITAALDGLLAKINDPRNDRPGR